VPKKVEVEALRLLMPVLMSVLMPVPVPVPVPVSVSVLVKAGQIDQDSWVVYSLLLVWIDTNHRAFSVPKHPTTPGPWRPRP